MIRESKHYHNSFLSLAILSLFYREVRKQLNLSHYLVLFRIARASQIQCLSRQLALGDPKLVNYAYQEVIKEKYSPLILSLKVDEDDRLRCLSHVLPSQYPIRVYKN